MAKKRGRPRKKVEVEEPIEEVEETVVEDIKEEVVEETIEEPKEEIKEEPKDDIYDLNSKSDSNLGGSYNPFGESVEEKAYRTPEIASAQSIADIEEPSFQKPSYDDLVEANENNNEGGDEEPVEKTGLDRFSQEEIKELPEADKEAAAEGLSQVVLGIYAMGCKQLGALTKISDKKLSKLESEDLIDTSMRVPIDKSTTASVRQIVDSINSQAEDAFEVTDDFKEKALPVMTSVFKKRGWGVTDEQNLLIMFGMDIAQKVTIVAQMRSAANYQLDAFMKMYQAQKGSSRPVQFTTSQNNDEPQDTAPRASQVVDEEVVNERRLSKEATMVASENPDLKVSESDLAQVDVDNV